MEGRDIGTVVLADAELKVFLIASIEERAYRRHKELLLKGIETPLERIRENLEERDRLDSTRADSPLTMAADAKVLDTSHLSIPEQVEIIISWARKLLS